MEGQQGLLQEGEGWGQTWQGAHFLCLLMPSQESSEPGAVPTGQKEAFLSGICKRRKACEAPWVTSEKGKRRVGTKVGLIPSFRGPRNLQSQVSPQPGFLK